ncbi:MGDG synthase family glycosyltransferase [Streptomyces nodosus]
MAEAAGPGPLGRPRRLLIVSASMGSGHDTVAGELARRARGQGHEAHLVDVLRLLPHGLGADLRRCYRASVRHFPWAYDVLYRTLLRRGPGRRPSGVPLARLAGDRLTELADRTGADVVVPVFHLAAQLTGHLRAAGRLPAPSVVFLIDFAVHRQWLHRGNDGYLCVTDEATAAVRQEIATPAETTGPLVSPEFFAAAAPTVPPVVPTGPVRPLESEVSAPPVPSPWSPHFTAYAAGRTPVLLAAGAWGVGSRLPATAGLLAGHGFLPVVLCGRNERLRRRLSRVPGVLALGWVDDMPALLRTSGALVDNAAGQTAVQALAAGLPLVGYRPLPGHGADGVRRMAALGLSELADDEAGLLGALDRLTTAGPAREHRVAHGRSLFRGDVLARLLEFVDASAG